MKITFTSAERKGLLLLLPLLAVIGFMVWLARRPSGDEALNRLADAQVAADNAGVRVKTEEWRNDFWNDSREGQGGTRREGDARPEASGAAQPFRFDPNTIGLRGLCRLGFTKKEAAGIISYRNGGKVFRDPYDFAGCYQVSIDMFERLEPFIVIGEKFRRQPVRPSGDGGVAGRDEGRNGGHDNSRHRDSLFVFDPNALDAAGFVRLGFTPAQSEAIIKYRDLVGGFKDAGSFAKCYQVSPERFAQLEPYIAIERLAPHMVDINSADSVTLCSVSGIGPVSAGRIVAMRRALGGFVSTTQLALVEGVTEQNFERMIGEIFASKDGIKKIDINFASPEQLQHPYIPGVVLRKILKTRQLKGGWRTIEDMVNEQILTRQQAARLEPYLVFNPAR